MKKRIESKPIHGGKSCRIREREGSVHYCLDQEPTRASQNNERSTFEVNPSKQIEKSFPSFRKPVEFGAFSLDIERKFHDSRKNLRQYVPPPSPKNLKLDLKLGYQTYIKRDEDEPERLDHLLQWIKLHRDRLRSSNESNDNTMQGLNTDFIAWRGHLVKILCTPYESRDPWRMDACRYNGTIYISEVETEARKMQRASDNERQKLMCYWGYKFEDYMTKPFSDEESLKTNGKIINNCEAFCSVVRTRLNSHSLLFGAEVDCSSLRNGKVVPTQSYIELKTSRIMEQPRQYRNFANFKLIKYWAQSYLAGVPTIICGMRDDNGFVRKLETYRTLEIPDIARGYHAAWDASVCMNFCDDFLTWMKSIVKEDNSKVIYSFKYEEPFEYIKVEKLPIDGPDVFLPDWF